MVKRINLKSFQNFLSSTSSGGIVLFFFVVLSIGIANSPLGPYLERLLQMELGYSTSTIQLKYPILLWINDGLMAIFFLFIGLEIKRELIEGELSSFKKALLPALAATGGVIVPAFIYFLFNHDNIATMNGWGIPMATDIAFALGVLSLLGSKVPASLKVFLSALAIVDDLMAILVIAIFYSGALHFSYLLYAAAVLLLLVVLNKMGVKHLLFYLIPGAFIWYFIHHSGVHATIAGVLTAITIPTNNISKESPLEKLEHVLSKPVNFFILPLFAFANTNIGFVSGMEEGLWSTMGLGIMLGLLIGKPIGITLMSWVAVKCGLSTLPSNATWNHIFGLGLLGGIGFTMSIFVALLSFDEILLQAEAKFCILIASFIAGFLGYLFLSRINYKQN
jgi:NhaA family Na+:H+ antiporter